MREIMDIVSLREERDSRYGEALLVTPPAAPIIHLRPMRRILNLSENQRSYTVEWTYNLRYDKSKIYRSRRFWKVFVNFQSNVRLDVEVVIHIGGGYLNWGIFSTRNILILRKGFGGTNLMKYIVPIIQKVLGEYLQEDRPPFIVIDGGQPGKRANLYLSWVDWQFSGYESKIGQMGIMFKKTQL